MLRRRRSPTKKYRANRLPAPCNMRRAGREEADETPSRKKPVPSPNRPRVAALLPKRAGVGLKPEHIDAILAERPDVGFFEIHGKNYMGDGGPPHRRLEAIRSLYPVSLHGVGLSIGSPRPPPQEHPPPPPPPAP